MIDFSQGQINASSGELDAAIDGAGFFVLRDSNGNTFYTRNGQFSIDKDGFLVDAVGDRVQGFDADGALHDITINDLKTNPAAATSTITLSGTLSTADASKSVSGVTVTDAIGGTHTLTIKFDNNTAAIPGSWLVTIMDGATTVGSGEVRFNSGALDPAYASVSFTYSPTGVDPIPLTITLDPSCTSPGSGSSTMTLASTDGHGVGRITGRSYDNTGHFVITYSNGQTDKSQQLAIANFTSTGELTAINGNRFKATDPQSVILGTADGSATSIRAKSLEASNVDLSTQFSAIIVAQRGYQASSELISTANQMLDTLLHMKG